MDFSNLNINNQALNVIVVGPGYGESILIKSPNSGWVVIDCFRLKSLIPVLKFLKDRQEKCEAILITHPHDDHMAGVEEMVEAFPEAVIGAVEPFALRDDHPADFENFNVCASAKSGFIRILEQWRKKSHLKWDLSRGNSKIFEDIEVKPLFPTKEELKNYLKSTKKKRINSNKIATPMKITWGSSSLILGSDLEVPEWKKVMKREPDLNNDCNFLKVSHHGSLKAQHKDIVDRRHLLKVTTPWSRGAGLPRFEDDEGAHFIVRTGSELQLTSLPFKYNREFVRPKKVTRQELLSGKIKGINREKITNSTAIVELEEFSETLSGWISFALTADNDLVDLNHSKGCIIIKKEVQKATKTAKLSSRSEQKKKTRSSRKK
jgi:hypothetical protein